MLAVVPAARPGAGPPRPVRHHRAATEGRSHAHGQPQHRHPAPPTPRLGQRLAALAATLLAARGHRVAVAGTARRPRPPDCPRFAIPGRGATVPFTEQEAEDAATNGT